MILLLNKMATQNGDPIQYFLDGEHQKVHVNEWLNSNVSMRFTGNIYCIRCGKKTSKSFAQGYCYPCFISAPETEDCVLRPEMCQAHNGIARDMAFAQQHCLIEHFVYLAASESIKVGITRHTQIPTRWIDQGAEAAIKIASVPNRFLAGTVEVALKKIVTDKTNWRAMLSNKIDPNPNFNAIMSQLPDVLDKGLHPYLLTNQDVCKLKYPVIKYSQKINSIDIEKGAIVDKKLAGIKGQYLIFDDGNVINIRKYNGYEVEIKVAKE